MGIAAARRDEPERAGAVVGRALAPWLLLASACGPAASLDASEPTGTGSSTTEATASTMAAVDGSGSTTAPTPPDDLPPDVPEPPPPGACPAACDVELSLAWEWDEAQAPPAVERELVGIVRAYDGALVVAENRDGDPWLTKVHPSGGPASNSVLPLSCDCRLADVTVDGSGQMVAVGDGPLTQGAQLMSLTGIELGLDPPVQTWITWDVIYGTEERSARVGSVIPLDDGTIAVLVVESSLDEDWFDEERFEIFVFVSDGSDWSLWSIWDVDSQLISDPPRRPVGTALPGARIVMTLPGPNDAADHVLWMEPMSGFVSALEPMPGPIEAMAAGSEEALVVASSRAGSPGQSVLHTAGLPLAQPPAWALEASVPTTTVDAPRMVVDALGSTYVAMPTTAGPVDAPTAAAVALWRIAADGTPVWSSTLPRPEGTAPGSLLFTLAHDGQGLVLATLVDGRLHLERREPGCRCD